MKKAIRITDGIFALCLVIIYSLVAFGNFVLPDKITAYSNKRVEYKSIYWLGDSSLYQSIFRIILRYRRVKTTLSFWE